MSSSWVAKHRFASVFQIVSDLDFSLEHMAWKNFTELKFQEKIPSKTNNAGIGAKFEAIGGFLKFFFDLNYFFGQISDLAKFSQQIQALSES